MFQEGAQCSTLAQDAEPLARRVGPRRHLQLLQLVRAAAGAARLDWPGRKPPFRAVKRPARPYKAAIEAIENQFTMENAKGA
jgi:hypothetical protein